jgi:hypothetical protein
MSYILYSAIARAGGIDFMLGRDSFARPHADAVKRHPARPSARPAKSGPARFAGLRRPERFAGLRRRSGQALIGLGRTLTRWGRHLAPQSNGLPANTNLTFAAE